MIRLSYSELGMKEAKPISGEGNSDSHRGWRSKRMSAGASNVARAHIKAPISVDDNLLRAACLRRSAKAA
jgi:hypothetical protein